LALHHFNSPVSLSFSKSLSKTEDNFQIIFQGKLNLLANNFVCLSKVSSSLGVAQNNPSDVNVLQLFGSDFSSEGSEAAFGAVLSSNFDVLILLGEHDCDEM
jgi:hypothetical protein